MHIPRNWRTIMKCNCAIFYFAAVVHKIVWSASWKLRIPKMNRNYWKKYLYHLDLFVWASMFLSIYSLNRTWCFSYLLSCNKNWAGFCFWFCFFKYLLDIDFKILFFQLELSAFTFNFAARFALFILLLCCHLFSGHWSISPWNDDVLCECLFAFNNI